MLGSPTLRTVILGSDAAGLLVHSTLIGYGILLTLLMIRGAGLHRHYLVVAAPIMALWVARLALFADGGCGARPVVLHWQAFVSVERS